MDDTLRKHTDYDGNGWTKYQNLVLDQLKEQKELLKFLMGEIGDIKKQNAVFEAIVRGWKETEDKTTVKIQETLEFIMEDEKGINSRLRALEELHKTEEKANVKIRGWWAIIGAISVVFIDIILEAIKFAWK